MPGLVRLTDPVTNEPFGVDAGEVAGVGIEPSLIAWMTDGINLYPRPVTKLRSVFGGFALALEGADNVMAQVNALRNQPVVVVHAVVNAPPAQPFMFDALPGAEKPKRTIGFAPSAKP